ncbi:MAG: phosphatidylglycerophosphatase [Ferruginibacter sp.]|uniref:phosphatidylglycerophosphatase A family protein n=1 Tax=Ferruginibacter sp. TaxID=1940288 RepID=UPI00265B029B|nr:phosphatidylglycerophosphatase A [Ferruginibacter sp.]MDB5275880.1 phosphatidylglycerophosphatase [Ferruginibacter sp.]
MKIYKTIASVLGIGYVGKGGGTIAALLYCIIWLLLPAAYTDSVWQMVITIFIIVAGVICGNEVDAVWGKDSSKVVIDEVAGMAIALLFVPHKPAYAFIALMLFRFFDIVKPLGIKYLEKWPGGWGVMADDILAGIYALILIQLLLQIQYFL